MSAIVAEWSTLRGFIALSVRINRAENLSVSG
jgi:hypothetical protein